MSTHALHEDVRQAASAPLAPHETHRELIIERQASGASLRGIIRSSLALAIGCTRRIWLANYRLNSWRYILLPFVQADPGPHSLDA